jgi:trans-AT polyketide synthase/acyltransferase/oxidoreductase domain-containing protein
MTGPGQRRALGAHRPGDLAPAAGPAALRTALEALSRPVHLVETGGALAAVRGGTARLGARPGPGELPLLGHAPALLPDQLGDPAFRAAHGLRFAYVAGEMANGIASEELVEAMGRAGALGFFGAAGLAPDRVDRAIRRLQDSLGELPFGFNLIHSPGEPALEAAVADLYLRRGVRLASASAFLELTLPVVRYRVHGIHRGPDGEPVTPNRLVAKVSRPEVARRFLAPPPPRLLARLVELGEITEDQARLAEHVPMAEDLTAEADSGGHTDNRPLVVLLPELLAVRDELHARHGYAVRPRVGAAGGIATPASAAAAFSLGAAYVMTGSVNQACLESGTSDAVRQMLAAAGASDVSMAPAADMFEMGVRVQVLARGTMFAPRAARLHELYRSHQRLEELPSAVRAELESKYFRCTLEEAWEGCRAFFAERDPSQLERAERDPRHRMALVFRSYLGRSSSWANEGVADRRLDYQVWCGPAMGAFNDWVRGSPLESWSARRAVPVMQNLLAGAAYLTRVSALRAQGVALPAELATFPARDAAALDAMIAPVAEEPWEAPEAAARRALQVEVKPAFEPVAIVGMGCVFPGAPDLRGYLRLLRTGTDTVREVPASHFDLDDFHDPDPAAPDRTYARRGAFLDPVPFDPTEFGIPPAILEATDTSQLLALVAARMALEDAGLLERTGWDRSRTAVILGVTGAQELVVPLAMRLGHPAWRRALSAAGVAEDQAEDVVRRIASSWVGWQESSFPGLLGTWWRAGSPTASTSAAPTASSTPRAPARSGPCTSPAWSSPRAAPTWCSAGAWTPSATCSCTCASARPPRSPAAATRAPSPRAPMARCSARGWGSWCCAASPTRRPTATASMR